MFMLTTWDLERLAEAVRPEAVDAMLMTHIHAEQTGYQRNYRSRKMVGILPLSPKRQNLCGAPFSLHL